jgi:hypothetical protein
LNASTVSVIIAPGRIINCGAARKNGRPSLSMAPHSGAGAWIPSPKKERPDTFKMIRPTSSDAITITGPVISGSTWRSTVRTGCAPEASEAST